MTGYLIRAAVSFTLALACQTALAQWVKFRFVGTVLSADAMPDGRPVPVGSRVDGSFSYDAETPVSGYWTDGRSFEYGGFYPPKASSMRFEFSGHRAIAQLPAIAMYNYLPMHWDDQMEVMANGRMEVEGVPYEDEAEMALLLRGDFSLTSLSLPLEIDIGRLSDKSGVVHLHRTTGTATVLFSIDKITSVQCTLDVSDRLNCR